MIDSFFGLRITFPLQFLKALVRRAQQNSPREKSLAELRWDSGGELAKLLWRSWD